jgi:hypothetical protein
MLLRDINVVTEFFLAHLLDFYYFKVATIILYNVSSQGSSSHLEPNLYF